jgi:3'-phosphoadenosine 5'-phosphosulfate sulfotransferase (PAPS reductase)/FAD synthetase
MGAFKEIQVKQIVNIDTIKRLFEMHIDRATLESYRLPVGRSDARVIVGLSGGADSSVLALFAAAYLAPHYPNLAYIFTDTQNEPESCYHTLDKIEDITGIKITRLVPEMGLLDLVDKYNGFLPSARARWCTKSLKIEPLTQYMKDIPSETGYVSLAGIRFDEADRDGISFQYSMETNTSAAFPFIDLEITKATVFDVLDRSIGIPETYKYRSRSGCYSCFFQRNSEAIGMLVNDPENFATTEKYEKLTDEDAQRYSNIPTTLQDAGIPAAYPVPAFIDLRKDAKTPKKAPEKVKIKKNDEQEDLFGFEPTDAQDGFDELFMAFALYTDSRLAQFTGREFTPCTYWQELITLSTSLSGIKSALGNHYKFKRTTPMPHYDLEDMQIVIAQIRFPKGTIDTASPSSDSYTWKSGTAYKQLRHLVRNCQTVLQKADLERRCEDAQAILANYGSDETLGLDAMEQVETLGMMMGKLPKVTGELVWEGLYTPSAEVANQVQMQLDGVSVKTERKVAREGLEHDEVPMACLACSI